MNKSYSVFSPLRVLVKIEHPRLRALNDALVILDLQKVANVVWTRHSSTGKVDCRHWVQKVHWEVFIVREPIVLGHGT